MSLGKCSHGGALDKSSSTSPQGGINKATVSPCYSPHHYLHQQAVDLAISVSLFIYHIDTNNCRPQSQSELTPIISYMELTHLGLEASNYGWK